MLAIALGVVFLKNHQSLDDPLIQPLFWLSVGGIWERIRADAGIPAGINGKGDAIAPSWQAAGYGIAADPPSQQLRP